MSNHSFRIANLGFPRIGPNRELKFAQEKFWKGTISEAELQGTARELRAATWKLQQKLGVNVIPSNDFSFYDQVLDALVLLGATPTRFGSEPVTLERYFQMARNSSQQTAMEMTKWFDTNYHYLVPEWSADLSFEANPAKAVNEFNEAKALGITTRPVIIGPLTLLALGKSVDGIAPLTLLPRLLAAYRPVLEALSQAGAEWIQIDEPILVTEIGADYAEAFRDAYAQLANGPWKLILTTYFGALRENLTLAASLPVAGLHVDLVRAPQQLAEVLGAIGSEKILSLGVVDGRNIWIADYTKAAALIEQAEKALGAERLLIAPSSSLLHVPHDASGETELPGKLQSWLSFAVQKLEELRELSAVGTADFAGSLARNVQVWRERADAETSFRAEVRQQLAALTDQDFSRAAAFAARVEEQRSALNLPLLPTTTIGSFPQTQDVRKQRAAHRSGAVTDAEYDAFLAEKITDCIRRQEEIGLDVLVHGEFERNDMVEYFGEQLKGFAFTRNGWVQSYGSRCVKPPVIYGDVWRPGAMTVRWSRYAQSLTKRPVKGMLTGPVTILQWSFVRNDIPRRDVAWQIALALREEIQDLEEAGIGVVQVDEPALREGLPLRLSDQAEYLDWSERAFRLAVGGARNSTQIHTHMCYSEFEAILDSIVALDADVISIESARSRMELLGALRTRPYPNEIGPGIYDIHSPRVPDAAEMTSLLTRALDVLKPDQLWVNPDCGLKTRGWEETTAALKNLCEAAEQVRASVLAKQ